MDDWKQRKEFLDGLEYFRKANELKSQAKELEEQARNFESQANTERKKIYDFLTELYEDKKKRILELQEEEMEQSAKMIEDLQMACEKIGHVYEVEIKKPSIIIQVYNFFRGKYSVRVIQRCVVCGKKNIYVYTTKRFSKISCSSPEIRKEHKELLDEFQEKYDKEEQRRDAQRNLLESEQKEIEASFSELCTIFGHDTEVKRYAYITEHVCKCCGKRIV